MKPIKLIIEGINSFDERQELDFERVGRSSLFCICGKTGAGKSTIFDSIMLALYGKSGRATLADVVNLSRTTAFVSFEFTERGDSYIVERTIKCTLSKGEGDERKRTANAECVLYKNGVIAANTVGGVAEIVTEVIGLDMSEFKNVYMLEQGEYAEFLKKPPAKQTEAVGKIFSLMRFADVYRRAKEMATAEDEKAATASAVIDEIGEDAPERLKAAKKKLTELKTKITTSAKELRNRKEEIDALETKRLDYAAALEKQKAVKSHAERLEAAELQYERAVQKLDEFMKSDPDADKAKLKDLQNKLNELTELNARDKQWAAAVEEQEAKRKSEENKRADAEQARAKNAELIAAAESIYALFDGDIKEFCVAANGLKEKSNGVKSAIEAFGTQDRVTRINAVRDVIGVLREEKMNYDALVTGKTEHERKKAEFEEKEKRLLDEIEKYSRSEKEREEEIVAAKAAADEAAEKLEKARLSSHAAAVREAINVGDVCPVCGGIYHGGECNDDSSVAEAKAAADKAAADVKKAEDALSEVKHSREHAAEEYNRIDGEVRDRSDKIAEIGEKIDATNVEPEIYKALAVALKNAKEHGESYSEKTAELSKAAPVLSAIEAELKAEASAALDAKVRAERLKESLGDYCGKTAAMLDAVGREEQELEAKVAGAEEIRAELSAEAEGAKGTVVTIRALLDEAVKSCPVDSPEFDEEAYNDLKSRYDAGIAKKAEYERDAAVTEALSLELADKTERLKNTVAERTAHYKKSKCYGEIAELTYGKAMLNFVALEYIERFTSAASEILSELSDGKYTMNYDSVNGFTVSDFLNGGKVRKTDTLSGGEMFLASLSVAIAIARTQSKGNNGFFFLDEGFGTLDDELIDTVYGALESLSRDCLVGVISHSGSLIGHMPSCVTVEEATDMRGSRITY